MCNAVDPFCGSWFFGAWALSIHYKLEHAIIVCAECGDQFEGETRIDQHFAEMHPGEPEDNDSSTELEENDSSTDDEEEPEFEDVMEVPSSDDDSDSDGSSGT